jgi:hypothetical protein
MVTRDAAPPFDKYRTRTVNTTTYVGYDNDTHRWVSISVDDLGGYAVSTSPGWSGDTPGITTITKISETQFSYSNTFKDGKGAMETLKGTCKKST